jgi:o-succinylbenzoate synthase
MYQAYFKKYILQFKHPSGTSRGILTEKVSWFIFLISQQKSEITGIGECAPLKGLSIDDRADFENKLAEVCINPNNFLYNNEALKDFPSIRFGLEMALLDLKQGGKKVLFPSTFIEGKDSISINGLVWMGSIESMLAQYSEKIGAGFSCIKLKIGSINFEDEMKLIESIRKEYSSDQVEIRVDANGAFKPQEAVEKLKRLSIFNIHSIEQPIGTNQWDNMAELCLKSPIPIALDEELIGIFDAGQKKKMLETINPQFIILKPTLLGGFKASQEWIALAEEMGIGWWVTSVLESNIGLNAIAQWTYTLGNKMPQGLGTGQLYLNNFACPLNIDKGKLFFGPNENWDLKALIL